MNEGDISSSARIPAREESVVERRGKMQSENRRSLADRAIAAENVQSVSLWLFASCDGAMIVGVAFWYNSEDRSHRCGPLGYVMSQDFKTPTTGTAPQATLEKLSLALRRSPINLYVQRLVPLSTRTHMRRYEVLLRSRAPGAPNSAPALLKAAVEHGLGAVIDRRVVRRLCQWLDRHRDVWADERAAFSVNLTDSTNYDSAFAQFVASNLKTADLPARLIGFELDVETPPASIGLLANIAESLESAGCPIVLDNFLPSEQSIDLLHLAGIELLKLAPPVTANVREEKLRTAIGNICAMAKSLGIQTVAKCTQGSQDQASLAALGIDFVQSHQLSPPSPIDSLCA